MVRCAGLITLLACLLAALPARAGGALGASTAFFYGDHVPQELFAHYDRVVVDPGNMPSPPAGTRATAYAYVSLGEVNPSRPWAREVPAKLVAGKNAAFGSDVIDVSNPEWGRFVIERVIEPAYQAGYRGFFFDTLDSYQKLAPSPDKAAAHVRGLAGDPDDAEATSRRREDRPEPWVRAPADGLYPGRRRGRRVALRELRPRRAPVREHARARDRRPAPAPRRGPDEVSAARHRRSTTCRPRRRRSASPTAKRILDAGIRPMGHRPRARRDRRRPRAHRSAQGPRALPPQRRGLPRDPGRLRARRSRTRVARLRPRVRRRPEGAAGAQPRGSVRGSRRLRPRGRVERGGVPRAGSHDRWTPACASRSSHGFGFNADASFLARLGLAAAPENAQGADDDHVADVAVRRLREPGPRAVPRPSAGARGDERRRSPTCAWRTRRRTPATAS